MLRGQECGCNSYKGFSAYDAFVQFTYNNRPAVPAPESPANGAKVVSTQPILGVGASSDADGDPVPGMSPIVDALGESLQADGVVLDGFLTKQTAHAAAVLVWPDEMPSLRGLVGLRKNRAMDTVALKEEALAARSFVSDEAVSFVATDLLWLDDTSLLDVPLLERRRLLESVIAPGFSPPMHVHHREDESFYILEGEVTMQCGAKRFRASAGAFVFLPRDVPHTFVVEGDRPARMLTLLTPGGGEGVFVEGGRQPDGDGLPPATPPDIEKLKQVSARFGAEIVGPPIAPRGLQPSAEPR